MKMLFTPIAALAICLLATACSSDVPPPVDTTLPYVTPVDSSMLKTLFELEQEMLKTDTPLVEVDHSSMLPENLASNAMKRHFSNLETLDVFMVYITGDDLLTGQLHVEILNSEGKMLYEYVDLASNQFAYDSPDPKDEEARRNYLKEVVANFFVKENFLTPALGEQEVNEVGVNDAFFKEVQNNPNSIGFSHRISAGAFTFVTYYAKVDAIKMYQECC